MNLDSALSIAVAGLTNVNRQLALVSQNIANAGTPDYAVEVSAPQSMSADGQGMGVRSGLVTRQIDIELQSAAFRQNSTVAGLQTRQAALQAIDTVQGQPGQGSDLGALLADLQNQFSTLANSPENQAQQNQVLTAAASLTSGINSLAKAYTAQRQAAQTDLTHAIASLNTALATIGKLSDRIVTMRVTGQSTADLENQRAATVDQVSQLLDLKTLEQSNGDLLVMTHNGVSLPTHSAADPLAIADASLQPGSFYPGAGVPGITVNGTDATLQFTGGRIGADLTLRDATLPTWEAELDEFAQGLASRFDQQGLRLFTDPNGAVPTQSPTPPVQTPYVGFATTIQVNSAVTATPSLVRDGTTAIIGSPTGPSDFTPNPPGGPAGFTTLINRVLTYALGTQAQAGVPQPALNVTGLGADGRLTAPFAPPPGLFDMAATLVATQAQESADTTSRLATEQAVQTSLHTRLAAKSGVSVDTEMATMITLQNAYGANARILATVQALFSELLKVLP